MTGRGGGGGRRVLLPPINMIFKLLQSNSLVRVWLYEQLSIRIEGKIRVRSSPPFSPFHEGEADGSRAQGFDEFMNLVIDDAYEVKQDAKKPGGEGEERKPLGQILLKGDNVSLIQSI
ncbi:hypothetical protein L249_5253 [Ophiocordyceps polyrhachis-furcata BCC 54312]|uniref:Small nuclear ribonucleoprotein E n=1 Tax=Ophiocordyceps polyrhachis-furcata BCC 54312 TaxID=1330021 RepID=A0A367L9U8_9HYPO|nr:hypothetical protein L249_5253 [Ophiocordyceps polyrhachis-furcata BCC 54312]